MKNILVLTPIYPADDLDNGSTPVVHFFTKEWVKLGYNVVVMHYAVNFPAFLYLAIKPFRGILASKQGFTIRGKKTKYREYVLDGVTVCRISLTKWRPHTRYSKREISKALTKTLDFCTKKSFVPDIICSHWVNPSYELMHVLKAKWNVPTCFVAHDIGKDLLTLYENESKEFISETNVFGYRSRHIKELFEKNFSCYDKHSFMCFSGIPQNCVSYENNNNREFEKISNYIFVGTLVERKYPAEIIPAVKSVYGDEPFKVSYIGIGSEKNKIIRFAQNYNCIENVHLYGYMDRQKVFAELCKNDVFVMISRNETFGLVYLEAMAAGCIVIASKNEGFDGIIENGVNGFLCDAGDVAQLSNLISSIRNMEPRRLNEISKNAQGTAKRLTDENVARNYVENIFRSIEE